MQHKFKKKIIKNEVCIFLGISPASEV